MKNRNLEHKDHWATPQDFMEKEIIPIFENNKGKEFFDPCPLNSKFDGLVIEWKQQNYINPPYSRKLKEAFIRKAWEEAQKGKLCVMLLPVSTSTDIFHSIIYPNAEIRFVKGRISFEGVNTFGKKVGKGSAPMHDSMIIIFKNKIGICHHERLKTGYINATKLVCLNCNNEWEWQPLKKSYVLTTNKVGDSHGK